MKRKWNERGSAVMEAALVLPVFCILLVGVLEFGRVLMIQQSLTNAAREAGRVAAISLDDTKALSSADQIAKNFLSRTGINLQRITVQPIFATVSGTSAVQVEIHYSYDSLLANWVPGIGHTLDLQSRVIMRREA